jgi:hypothetical protein
MTANGADQPRVYETDGFALLDLNSFSNSNYGSLLTSPCSLAVGKDLNFPFAYTLFIHETPFNPSAHQISYSQDFKPAFNPVHHPTAVSIDHPDLFHPLVSEALPTLPIPMYQIF